MGADEDVHGHAIADGVLICSSELFARIHSFSTNSRRDISTEPKHQIEVPTTRGGSLLFTDEGESDTSYGVSEVETDCVGGRMSIF